MEFYLIKWAACLGIFFLFYKLFLERASMHLFKRFYLLGSLAASLIIPWITFTQYVIVPEQIAPSYTSEVAALVAQTSDLTVEQTSYLPAALWILYGLGVLFFSLKFVHNLFRIIQKIKRNPKLRDHNIFHVLLNAPTTPHTFFSYIFLNKRKFEAREIPEEVLLHERTHAREKHSIDVLFIELLQIVFWFNPFLYAIKHSIKLNHEFLADRAVLNKGVSTANYQKILLAFSSTAGTPLLANSINYSSNPLNQLFSKIAFGQIKKRFTVMKTHTSKRGVLLRTLTLLPLLAVLVYGFSNTQQVEKKTTDISELTKKEATPRELVTYNKLAKHYNEQFVSDDSKRIVKLKDLSTLERIYASMSEDQKAVSQPFPECIPPPPLSQDEKSGVKEKATPKQIREYNKLAKKYNEMPKNNLWIDVKELSRMRYLYDLMTLDQRKNAEPYPSIPPPPPSPDAPNDFEFADPPPPPKLNPKEHLRKMADEGATFYYEDKEISYDYVIDLVLFNKNLNIQTKTYNSSPPMVYISRDFVYDHTANFSNNGSGNNTSAGPKKKPETPASILKKMIPLGAQFYFNGKKITPEEAKILVEKSKILMVEVRESPDKKPEVFYLDGC